MKKLGMVVTIFLITPAVLVPTLLRAQTSQEFFIPSPIKEFIESAKEISITSTASSGIGVDLRRLNLKKLWGDLNIWFKQNIGIPLGKALNVVTDFLLLFLRFVVAVARILINVLEWLKGIV